MHVFDSNSLATSGRESARSIADRLVRHALFRPRRSARLVQAELVNVKAERGLDVFDVEDRACEPVCHTSCALTIDYLNYLFYIAEEMKRGELLGSLEHIILLALVRFDGSAHGMIVRREIEERTGRNISIGAVYATLERLEAKGYVSSFTGEPTAERGGRAKRLFRVEALGKRALQISEQTIRSMTVWPKGRVKTV